MERGKRMDHDSITAIEELAGVTILCSDKTGTLTTNKLTIDKRDGRQG